MSLHAYLFDAQGQDQPVALESAVVEAITDQQLLWVDLHAASEAEFEKAVRLLSVPEPLVAQIRDPDGVARQQRPRLDLYSACFHLRIVAVQERDTPPGTAGRRRAQGAARLTGSAATSFQLVSVHFVVFANLVLTVHTEPAAFLGSFDRRIKEDSHLDKLDGPAFLSALLKGIPSRP